MASSMDVVDSRKRPMDVETESYTSKRLNHGTHGAGDGVLLKVLIPASVAGVILGKGGETITKLQADTGANIKMSKGSDYYPGTTERVCILTGTAENVKTAHNIMLEKIRERMSSSDELKIKILVPNATVGMIIGKGGCYIRQIKEDTGAYVQISQKSPDASLLERSITVSGNPDQMSRAFDMVFKMIVEDPQSGTCPNLSYADYKGPVPNASPVGSPFALPGGGYHEQGSNMGGNMMMSKQQHAMSGVGGGIPGTLAIEALKSTLRSGGYSVQACEEISVAMCTLGRYGLLGYGGFAALMGGGSGGFSGGSGLSMEYLVSILNGGVKPMYSGQSSVDMGGAEGYYGSSRGAMASDSFNSYNTGATFNANQNSFGLGTAMAGSNGGGYSGSTDQGSTSGGTNTTRELQVGEKIIGAVLGKGGKAIVEIQRMTGAQIQISKKGVFAPGTSNRIVTVSGMSGAVDRAVYMVQQCIQQEELKRQRQDQLAHQSHYDT